MARERGFGIGYKDHKRGVMNWTSFGTRPMFYTEYSCTVPAEFEYYYVENYGI